MVAPFPLDTCHVFVCLFDAEAYRGPQPERKGGGTGKEVGEWRKRMWEKEHGDVNHGDLEADKYRDDRGLSRT